MFIAIINDSCDDNAKSRQTVRWSTIFPKATISFIGVGSNLGNNATIEAAGNMIDIFDASDGNEGIVALNVAPRGQTKDGENGSSFCYFSYKKILVITTIKGYNLSLAKKLELTDHFNLLDIGHVLSIAEKKKLITKKQNYYIKNSQFRSLNFQPRVAKWLTDGVGIPYKKLSVKYIPDIPHVIWSIDSFGNAKTTLLKEDLPLEGKILEVSTNIGNLRYYERLKDVPDGETAIYTGSSGIENKRFLEIATQNREGSAEKTLNLKVGKEIKIT